MGKKKYFLIIILFSFIILLFLFVNNNKITYYVTLKGTGFDINQTLSCFTYSSKCKVKLPVVNRVNYELVGWSEGDLINPEYSCNENIEVDSNATLYAITRKKLTLFIDDEEISCYIYNDELSCQVDLPNTENVIYYDSNGNKYKPGDQFTLFENMELFKESVSKKTLKIYGKDSLSCNLYNNEYCNIELPYYDNVTGYSLSNNGNINYKEGSIIKLTRDIVIYPIYENKVEYTITINGNGANVENDKLSCKGDNCSIKLPIITREGYEIIGYNLKANDKTALYKSGQIITVSSNMILYAITKKEIVVSLEIVENEKCDIYNNQSICSVYIPIVDGVNGWSIEKNSSYVSYLGGNSYGFSKDINLYPVKNKNLSANFIVNGNIYITKSCVLDGDGCYIDAPIIDIKGITIYEYSTSINGATVCLAGNKCYINEDTDFYVHKGSYYRELDVYDGVTIGKTTIEVQKGCSYSDSINDVRDAYNYFPKMFTDVKITFLTNSDYVKMHGSNTSGKNIIIETNDYALTFIDINCDTYKNYDYPSEVIVHEFVHTYDRKTYFNQNKIALSDTSIVNDLYNKYINMSNRPMRDYSYSNKQEFMADMVEYYFLKYNKNQNINIPNDIKEFVEKYFK